MSFKLHRYYCVGTQKAIALEPVMFLGFWNHGTKKTPECLLFEKNHGTSFCNVCQNHGTTFGPLKMCVFKYIFLWFKHCNSILKLLLLVFNTIIFSTPLFCNPVVLIKYIPVVLPNIIQWFQSNYMPPSKSTPVILVKCTPIVFAKFNPVGSIN